MDITSFEDKRSNGSSRIRFFPFICMCMFIYKNTESSVIFNSFSFWTLEREREIALNVRFFLFFFFFDKRLNVCFLLLVMDLYNYLYEKFNFNYLF